MEQNKFQLANKNFEVNYNKLDKSQCDAINNNENKVVIQAPAGSGKTTVLITAIAAHRYENLNDRICAITYTRAARAEMEARLMEMGIYDVEVTTIHVWARNLLNYFADKYNFKIRILEEPQIKEILRDIIRQYLVRSKVKTVNLEILYSYITGNKNMDITDNYRRTLNALEERYIGYKRANVLYDFTDYPQYLWDVMSLYDEYVTNIDALFVDEFQDVDITQLKIFDRVVGSKKCYIGDEKQSIYQFRGADGQAFRKLDNFSVFKLKYNYRSYQEIVDYATSVYYWQRDTGYGGYMTELPEVEKSKILCSKGYGGRVSIIDAYHDVKIFSGEDSVTELTNVDWRSMSAILVKAFENNAMILCRTNKMVKSIQSLGYTNVSTIHQAKGLEYDRVVVIDYEIKNDEDLNIAYVAMTRAKDDLIIVNWSHFERALSYWVSDRKLGII